MTLQQTITVIGKLLPILLDLAGFIPVIGSFASAIKLAEDGVALEEGVVAFLATPQGAKVKRAIDQLAHDLGYHAQLTGGAIRLESRDEVQGDFDSGLA